MAAELQASTVMQASLTVAGSLLAVAAWLVGTGLVCFRPACSLAQW
jgi:hypothetical protein